MLSVAEFGHALLTSGDLDPVYVMLHRSDLSRNQLKRWLVAYWCFYHSGVASYLTESSFWSTLKADLASFPRGTERRHFRGALAKSSVAELEECYPNPECMVDFISLETPSLKEVFDRVCSHRGFGPWIAFKVADMLDRCLGVPIDFDDAHLFLFKDPAAAVDLLWKDREYYAPTDIRRKVVIDELREMFGDLPAPPDGRRKVGLAEIETILCKYKSHVNGRYPVGKDSREILHHLDGWGPLAERLKAGVPG